MEIDLDDYAPPIVIALQLGVSAETVRRWCRQNRVPHVRLPGGLLFVHRDVLRLNPAGGSVPHPHNDTTT